MRQLPVIVPLGPKAGPYDGGMDLVPRWIHETIQGEGAFIGTPSIFLRLFGCNLTCENCDTKYTWHPQTVHEPVRHPVAEVAMHIGNSYMAGLRHLVITGGEPLLQADALCDLFNRLPEDLFVTIETNGTIFDERVVDSCAVNMVSLSPKLPLLVRATANKGRWLPDSLIRWLNAAADFSQMKLVVESPEDIESALEVFQRVEREGIPKERLFIQPEWNRYGSNLKEVLPHVIHAGYRVLGQQHKTWGVY